MDIKYSLALVTSLAFLSLVRCDNIVVTTRLYMSSLDTETINISFSRQRFTELYECLCTATTQQCTVSVFVWSSPYYASRISREEHEEYPNEDLPCKHYQCQYREDLYRFTCKVVDPTSCQRNTSVYYPGRNCGNTKCVSIIWKYSNEKLDYSHFTDTIHQCNSGCVCSTAMTPTASTKLTTTALNTTGKAAATTTTTTKTKTTSLTTQKTTSLAQISSVFSEETTNPQEHSTAEINATVHDSVSDSQKQNDPVPIVVGVVVALTVLASTVAVAVFLWKRKKGAENKAVPDCHEYANLPAASVCTKECDATTNVVNSHQDHPSLYVNYDIDNCSFENDHANVRYFNKSNNDFVDKQHSDNQLYANCEPSRSLAVAPTDCSQPENTSSKINGGFVSVSNNLEESDDFTKRMYALANHSLVNDPGHAAGASHTDKHSSDFHSNSRTNESHTNSRTAISTAQPHPYKRQIIEDDSGYSLENKYKYTELTANMYSLNNVRNPQNDFEYAKAVDSTNSINDNGYSVSNSDLNSNATYSMAATPVKNVVTNDAPPSHDYAKLGKGKHHFVNPYDVLRQTKEAPIPKQANTKQISHGKLPGQMDPYSVAESISEQSPQNNNIYSFQVVDSAALNNQYVNTFTNDDEIFPRRSIQISSIS